MYSVRLAPEPSEYDKVIAALWDAGTTGIVEGHGYLDAFFDNADSARQFGEPQPALDKDWVREIEDTWPALSIGEKFFVVPPWNHEPTPPGRFRIEINPGAQCGTGRHPTTQFCLEAMEKLIRPGDSVLDVGSGSGILSRAAKLLGAGRVIACDIDPDVLKPVPFFVGSVDAVRSGSFDVVVANISEDVVGCMRPDFERVARRRILSGFQDENGQWTCVVDEGS